MSSSPKALDPDMVASVARSPTMIMVTALCGRVLSEWALWLLPMPLNIGFLIRQNPGRPRFGSVRIRFGNGTAQVVPVFGSGASSATWVFCVSVQFNRKGRFRFRFRFLENGSGGSGSAFGFEKFKTVPTVPVSSSRSVPEPP